MSGLDDVALDWKGKTYAIKARKRMPAMAKVEQHLTFGELNRFLTERGTIPVYTTAMAFGTLLRFAGCSVSDEEVARDLFTGGDLDPAIDALAELLAPPGMMAAVDDEGGAAEPAANPPGPASSS